MLKTLKPLKVFLYVLIFFTNLYFLQFTRENFGQQQQNKDIKKKP